QLSGRDRRVSTPLGAGRRLDAEETLAIRALHCHLLAHGGACRRRLAPYPGYHTVTTGVGRALRKYAKDMPMTRMTHDSSDAQSLTDRALRALTRPKPAPVAIFDTDVKHLQVRASVNGTVSFGVLKRPPGSRKLARFPVGTYPLTTLAEA